MNKLVITLQLILLSSTVFAQANSDPLEQDFITKKQQYEKAQQDLNKRYGEVLSSLHTQVKESKLKPNPELLKKIEAELSALNIPAPGQWYLGEWELFYYGRFMNRIRITPEGYQTISASGSHGKVIPLKDIGNGKVETMLGQFRIEFSKQTATGNKMRWEVFTRQDPERWEGARVK
jgi:hypothetical protein